MRWNRKEVAEEVVKKSLYTPYVWGGANPLMGLDCSQYVIEILHSCGFPLNDTTSQGLYDHFRKNGIRTKSLGGLKFGDLLFWNKGDKSRIIHVAFALSSSLMTESAGGDRRTTSKMLAAKHGAYVRIRGVREKNLYKILNTSKYFR